MGTYNLKSNISLNKALISQSINRDLLRSENYKNFLFLKGVVDHFKETNLAYLVGVKADAFKRLGSISMYSVLSLKSAVASYKSMSRFVKAEIRTPVLSKICHRLWSDNEPINARDIIICRMLARFDHFFNLDLSVLNYEPPIMLDANILIDALRVHYLLSQVGGGGTKFRFSRKAAGLWSISILQHLVVKQALYPDQNNIETFRGEGLDEKGWVNPAYLNTTDCYDRLPVVKFLYEIFSVNQPKAIIKNVCSGGRNVTSKVI